MYAECSLGNQTTNMVHLTLGIVGHVLRVVAGIITELWGRGQCEWCPPDSLQRLWRYINHLLIHFWGRVPALLCP